MRKNRVPERTTAWAGVKELLLALLVVAAFMAAACGPLEGAATDQGSGSSFNDPPGSGSEPVQEGDDSRSANDETNNSTTSSTTEDTSGGGEVEVTLDEPDGDGDGVLDHLDECDGTPSGVAVDETGCALDGDGDGVPDHLDDCAGTAPGVGVDDQGCPRDKDGDGHEPPGDCNDMDPAVNPDAVEIPGNEVDEDCVDGPAPLPACPVVERTVNPLPQRAWALEVLQGDREFGGNTVLISAQVESSWDAERVRLRLSFLMSEAGGDRSRGRGDFGWQQVFQVGDGERIVGVTADGRWVNANGVDAKLDTEDNTHGAHTESGSGVVASWRVVADTDDDDIGNDKGDQDANITASFRLLRVQVEQLSPNCTPS